MLTVSRRYFCCSSFLFMRRLFYMWRLLYHCLFLTFALCKSDAPVSIFYKSTAGRYRPVSYPLKMLTGASKLIYIILYPSDNLCLNIQKNQCNQQLSVHRIAPLKVNLSDLYFAPLQLALNALNISPYFPIVQIILFLWDHGILSSYFENRISLKPVLGSAYSFSNFIAAYEEV